MGKFKSDSSLSTKWLCIISESEVIVSCMKWNKWCISLLPLSKWKSSSHWITSSTHINISWITFFLLSQYDHNHQSNYLWIYHCMIILLHYLFWDFLSMMNHLKWFLTWSKYETNSGGLIKNSMILSIWAHP